ncbi:hypothetical protein F5883DRAFT_652062 [Diaporthe sp. PMI_573]|nr:hypothetical protein F5883DRAFT_652062 [Diaporthaceae sp. PMI_573]
MARKRWRRHTSEEAELVPASLGLDFGAKTSKLTLVTDRQDRGLEIDRVLASVPQSYSTTRSLFEIPAEAALGNGRKAFAIKIELKNFRYIGRSWNGHQNIDMMMEDAEKFAFNIANDRRSFALEQFFSLPMNCITQFKDTAKGSVERRTPETLRIQSLAT